MLISPPTFPLSPVLKGIVALAEYLSLPCAIHHHNRVSFQLGKGGMLPAGGLAHINGLAGFAPGVLNPTGKNCRGSDTVWQAGAPGAPTPTRPTR